MPENLVPFEQTPVPSFFSEGKSAKEINKDLTAHDNASYPFISIRGKQFRIVRGGEETLLTNPLDPRSPATYITAVLIKIPSKTSKTYYGAVYDSGAVAGTQKPVCWSTTGTIPDAGVANPCAASCMICPKNQFGSAVSLDGTPGKGKACRDSIRVALAAVDNLQEPMMLKVPPTSIKGVVQLGYALSARNIPYNGVIVEISFDTSSVSQKLLFRPMGMLNREQYQQVLEMENSDIVKQITGMMDVAPAAKAPAKPVTPPPATAKAVATGTITPEAVKEATIKAPVVKPEEDVPQILSSKEVKGLDNLKFDD